MTAPTLLAYAAAQDRGFALWPETASTGARDVDLVYLSLLALAAFFVILIGLLALGYGVKYRAGSDAHRGGPIKHAVYVELTWIVVPLVITIGVFLFGASVYLESVSPPSGARSVYVVGKQWMWKVLHPAGRQEINELHVPAGEPVKLLMTSQDVIHSFFVPALRKKQDVLPNRYTTMWFTPSEPGTYDLFCAEYCGAQHALMRGKLVVLSKPDFQTWLAEEPAIVERNRAAGTEAARPPFEALGCAECHVDGRPEECPPLEGLFGSRVTLRGGGSAVVDESYLRRSILEPNAEIVEGYDAPSAMPSYQNQLSERQVMQLIEYIKSLEVAPKPAGEEGS